MSDEPFHQAFVTRIASNKFEARVCTQVKRAMLFIDQAIDRCHMVSRH
jgi:hypothetical protein